MASAIYPKGVKTLLSSSASLLDGTLKLLPVNDTFVFDNTHEFLTDVSAFAVDGVTAASMTGVTVSLATATLVKVDALDTPLLWSAVTDPDDIGGGVVYYDTGVAATSFLIAFLDSGNFVTTGSDVQGLLNASGSFGIQC